MSDRSVRSYPNAGRLRYTPSSSHTHWHLLGFQRYELRTLAGDLVVRDRKAVSASPTTTASPHGA